MRRITIILVALLLSLAASAQFHWGISVGPENMYVSEPKLDYGGFHVGPEFRYDFRKGKGVGIQTGLYYQFLATRMRDNRCGAKPISPLDDYTDIRFHHSTAMLHGVQVPILLTYHYDFYRDWGIVTYLGPTLNMYMRSSAWHRFDYMLNEQATPKRYGESASGFGSIQIGGNVGVGFHYKHLLMRLTYQLYVSDAEYDMLSSLWTSPLAESFNRFTHHQLGLGIMYQF